MYQKIIINQNGVLKFGKVYQHVDLLDYGEECTYGGGLWKKDEARKAILLYGRSFAFGTPNISQVKEIEWSGLDEAPLHIFYVPEWPNENRLIPVYVKSYQP